MIIHFVLSTAGTTKQRLLALFNFSLYDILGFPSVFFCRGVRFRRFLCFRFRRVLHDDDSERFKNAIGMAGERTAERTTLRETAR